MEDAAGRTGERRRGTGSAAAFGSRLVGAAAVAAISVPLVLAYEIVALDPQPLNTWLREDGAIEDAQAGLFFIAAFCFAVSGIRSRFLRRHDRLWRYWPIIGMALLMFIFCGEELSWGQRVFGWATPETGIFAANEQNETSIHNLRGLHQTKPTLVNVFILGVGVVLSLIAAFPRGRRALGFLAFPVAPLQYLPVFVATYLVHSYRIYPHAAYGYGPREYSETLLALAMALVAVHGCLRADSLFRSPSA